MTQTINIDVTFDSPGSATLAFCLLHHAAMVVARGCREQLEHGFGQTANVFLEQCMTRPDMREAVAALAGQLMQTQLAALASTLKVDEPTEAPPVERSPAEIVRDGLARVFEASNIVIGMEGWTPPMLEAAAGWILEVENGAPLSAGELLTRVSVARATAPEEVIMSFAEQPLTGFDPDDIVQVARRGYPGSTPDGGIDDANRDPQPGDTGALEVVPAVDDHIPGDPLPTIDSHVRTSLGNTSTDEVLMTVELRRVVDEGHVVYRILDKQVGQVVGESFIDGAPIDALRDLVDHLDWEHRCALEGSPGPYRIPPHRVELWKLGGTPNVWGARSDALSEMRAIAELLQVEPREGAVLDVLRGRPDLALIAAKMRDRAGEAHHAGNSDDALTIAEDALWEIADELCPGAPPAGDTVP